MTSAYASSAANHTWIQKQLRVHSNLIYQAFNAINQVALSFYVWGPQLSCNASEDCTNAALIAEWILMFLYQVCPIILCGSDIIVHVIPAAGLYGKERFFVLFFISECGSSTPICVSSLLLWRGMKDHCF